MTKIKMEACVFQRTARAKGGFRESVQTIMKAAGNEKIIGFFLPFASAARQRYISVSSPGWKEGKLPRAAAINQGRRQLINRGKGR